MDKTFKLNISILSDLMIALVGKDDLHEEPLLWYIFLVLGFYFTISSDYYLFY